MAVLAVVQGQYFGGTSDQFYHVAAIRNLVGSRQALTTDPFFGTATRVLDPTTGASHSVFAALSWVSHIDPVDLLPGLSVACAVVLVCSMWSLGRRASGKPGVAMAVTLVAMAASGFDARPAAYPNHFSLGLAIFGLVLLSRVATTHRCRPLFASAVVVGYAVAVTHLGSAELYAIGAASTVAWVVVGLVATRGHDGAYDPKALPRLVVVGLVVAAVAAPVVVPRLLALKGTNVVGQEASQASQTPQLIEFGKRLAVLDPRALPGGPLNLAAVPLVVLAAAQALRRRDQRAFLVVALGSLPLTVLLDPLVAGPWSAMSPYMFSRVAALLAFAPLSAVAWGFRPGEGRRVQLTALACGACVLAAVALALPATVEAWTGPLTDPSTIPFTKFVDVRTAWGVDEVGRLQHVFGKDWPVVAAYPNTALELAAIAPVRPVAVTRGNTPAYFEANGADQRRLDMEVLFGPSTPKQLRLDIVQQYDVRFVVLDLKHIRSLSGALSAFAEDGQDFTLVHESDGLFVFEVRQHG
jgi:hypothetical protein